MSTRAQSARWRRYAVTPVALACLLSFGLAPHAAADTGDDKDRADKQVQLLQDQVEGTSAELVTAYLALKDAQAKLPAAQATLAQAQAAAQAAAKRNAEIGVALQVAKANEARATERLAVNAASLDETQRDLDAFAADMFQGGGDSQLSIALGATSPDDFATRLVLADTVTAMTNEAIGRLASSRADGEATKAYLNAVKAEVEDLKRQAESALVAANAAKATAQQAKDAVDALVATHAQLAADVEARKANELKLLAQAEAEQERLRLVLVEEARKAREAEAARVAAEAKKAAEAAAANKTYTPPPKSDAAPGAKGGFLNYPANAPITSGYAWRLNPVTGVYQLHAGIDFGISCGTPVYATATGTVIQSGMFYSYGNRIVISHGIVRGVGLATTYNHLSRIVVASGPVVRGQLIGYSGTTGHSTGCHLHFETVEDGVRTNPIAWI